METLGQRWGWEKTKVWRFFQKHGDVFTLYRLPGSYGCLIFNKLYPVGIEVSLPTQEEVVRILEGIRILGRNTHKSGSDHDHLNKLVAWYSRRLTSAGTAEDEMAESIGENGVALSAPIIRAYLSLCRNCKNCDYDCKSNSKGMAVIERSRIRGSCVLVDLTKIAKECFTYGQTG